MAAIGGVLLIVLIVAVHMLMRRGHRAHGTWTPGSPGRGSHPHSPACPEVGNEVRVRERDPHTR